MMTMLLKYWKPLTLLLLVVGMVVGYQLWASYQQGIGEERATARYNLKIEIMKREAAVALAVENKRVIEAERSLVALKNTQEVKDAENRKIAGSLTARLHELGRLRDPNAGRWGGSGGPGGQDSARSGDCSGNRAEASGVLSKSASDLLRKLALEADEINLAFISCRAYVESLRSVN